MLWIDAFFFFSGYGRPNSCKSKEREKRNYSHYHDTDITPKLHISLLCDYFNNLSKLCGILDFAP